MLIISVKKFCLNCRFALPLALLVFAAENVFSASFTVLHTFTSLRGTGFSNSDGAFPEQSLIISGSMLYGTAEGGGNGSGVIFGINTNGGGFTNLHSFSVTSGGSDGYGDSFGTNGDGAGPVALLVSGGTLYGTTKSGGPAGNGTVFKLNLDGRQFAVLHSFTNGDAASFPGSLVLTGSTLYGLSLSNHLTVYAMDTNGNGFSQLFQFSATYYAGGLALSGEWIYLTADTPANPFDTATIFGLTTNGTDLETLWSLDPNANGGDIFAAPVIANNSVYAVAGQGGPGNSGSIFSVSTSGGGFELLHAFSASPLGTNSDGVYAVAPVVLSGQTVFGSARGGGWWDNGTLFQVNTDGTGFNTLHMFSEYDSGTMDNYDGALPWSELVVANNTLYGTAYYGGANGVGTIFALSLPPCPISLNYQFINNNVVLSWTNASFNLQCAPSVSGLYTNIPGASSPYTNAMTGAQLFFRLVAD